MQFHPDLCAPSERTAAAELFKEITAAYTKLTRGGANAHVRNAAYTPEQAAAQWARSAAAAAGGAGGRGPTKYSNGVVGAVIAAPLVLLGMWLQHKSSRGTIDFADTTRPNGILLPPENPFLRDDLRPRTRSRFWSTGWNANGRKQMGSPPKRPPTMAAAAASPAATSAPSSS